MIWILKNWQVLLTFFVTAGVAVFLHLFFGFIDDTKHAEELETAKLNVIHACQEKMQITYEVSDEYQKKITSLNRRVGQLKRMYDSAQCLPITTAASRPDAASSGTKLSGQGGIRTDWLIDLGASCEDMRLKVIGLQDFIKKERQ